MLRRKDKEKIVTELTEKLKGAKATIFADYRGLAANEVRKLRKEMRSKNVEYGVFKKTLVEIAFKNVGVTVDMGTSKGPVALAMSLEDEVIPAKILAAFGKGKETPKIVGGVLQSKYINEAEAINLAKLPGKEELIARLVGSINAPLSNFVGVLSGNIRQIVYVLNAIKEAKGNN